MNHYTMKALWIYWIRGNDEVELTNEESSDNEDDVAEVFRIDTNIFDYETPLLITEYLVNISKRRAFWSLNEDILKITILTTNTSYPSRKIRRIRACTHQRPQRKQAQYAVKMGNPNITMEEYMRLQEEKAHRRGKVYNWETATYAIVFNDTLTSEATLSCDPTVSSLNNDEIDLIISFDESDDEDCTKEFPAIVYNDAQTSKLDFLTEPTLSPQHIDEFNLKDETSLSECDEEEQNVIYFNDLFPFNVIYLNDLKSDNDNDNDKIDVEHSSGDLSVKPLPDTVYTAYPNPMDTAYRPSGHYPVFIFSTVYTTYSLNEYNVFDFYRSQYGVFWGMDMAYRLPI
ncbi:hypothetical protein Tco_1276083 [Tanacetum coccineum]